MTDKQRQELRALCESIIETIDDPLADETEDWWMHLFWRDFFALRSLCNTVDREMSGEPRQPERTMRIVDAGVQYPDPLTHG